MLNISAVEAFSDNYIWVLHNQTDAIAVDPGDATPLLAFIDAHQLDLKAVLITHRHNDHIGGLPELLRRFPGLTIIGPATLASASRKVRDADQIEVLGATFDVLAVPGHTLDHLAFHCAPWLFCGDTLFAGGCGRLFEGSPAQMHASLTKLAALPPETLIYPAHEYTVANLRFARAAEPENEAVTHRLDAEKAKRDKGLPTLPATLSLEHETNPFLRTTCENIKNSAHRHAQRETGTADEVFAILRAWKDGFRNEID